MSAATDGEVLASHRPRHPVGWLPAFALPAAIYAVAYSSIALLPIAACLSFPFFC